MPFKPDSPRCKFHCYNWYFEYFATNRELIDAYSLPLHCLIDLLPPSWAKTSSLLTFPQFFISLPSNCLRAGASATIGLSHHYNGGHHLIIISANAAAFSITLRPNVTQNSSCGNVFPFASVLSSDHFWILSLALVGELIKTNIRIRLRRSVFMTKMSQNCNVEPFSSLLNLDLATM